jgi:hypothetical protein
MRILLFLALTLSLVGCDIGGLLGGGSADNDLVRRLDGSWSLAYTQVDLQPDGTEIPRLSLPAAGTMAFSNGETFAIDYIFSGDRRAEIPNGAPRFSGDQQTTEGTLFVDDTALRVNFIPTDGTFFGGDIMVTIDENSTNRQVWTRYQRFEDQGFYRRTRFTLTR